jgi:biotin transport system substrate-specific component
MAVCAWISIPFGYIAFTLQTFAVMLALFTLGGKWGTASIWVYLLLGAVGLPVFSGFRGGIGMLLSVSGGFLWGFLLSGLTYRALERWGKLPALVVSLPVCYLCGCLWFGLYAGGGLGFIIARCVLPYLIPDFLKLWLAWGLARRISKVIKFPSRA